jgi:hypothetical protein
MDGWMEEGGGCYDYCVLMYHVAFPSDDINQYPSISPIWSRLNMLSSNAYLQLSLRIVIDFPSFLPPLVTVGRLGSDSGGWTA